jgi:predicted outer membrane protein
MRFINGIVTAIVFTGLIASTGLARSDKDDAKLNNDDKNLIKSAMRELEIIAQESRLARDRGESDGVQHFAALATREADDMINSLRELGNKHDFDYDHDPSKADVKEKKQMENLKGKELDRLYMSDMTREYEETLKIFKDGAKKADNEELRHWFAKNQDTVHERSENANELYRKVKAKD